jgi:hypothetical protein
MKSTQDVIDHYLDAFEVGDPDKILAVFSDESVVICGDTIYRGLSEIKRFFEYVMTEVLPPGVHIDSKHHIVEDDIAYFVWSSTCVKCIVPLGVDTLMVKDGVITHQTAVLDPEYAP